MEITNDTVKEIINRLGPQLMQPVAHQVAALPGDFKLHDIEQFLPEPTRIRQQVTVHRPKDFIAYVNRYKTPSALITVAATVDEAKTAHLARCILDFHPCMPNPTPTWGDHRITLAVKPSPEYDLLASIDNKLLKQSDFAQRLSDLSRFVRSHSAADILETVRAVTLMTKGEFVTETDDVTGSRRFIFNVQVDARAQTKTGKTLEVPKHIVFEVRVFDDTPIQIEAELIVRAPSKPEEELMLGIRLPARRWIEQQVIDETTSLISQQTGLLTIVGKAG